MTRIKTFFLDQHGCAKNQVDGELIIGRLLSLGLEQTFTPENADLIFINSCGFIESAKKESFDAVFFAKENFPNAKIVLGGCLAERYASSLKDDLVEADAIFGNGDIFRIDEVISSLENNVRPVNIYEQKGVCNGERKMFLGFRGSSYVKVTEGCSNYCSFCAIPIIRGKLRSRNACEIIEEIKTLVSQGIVEINLIGQDLAAYGTGDEDNVFGTGKFSLPSIDETGTNIGTQSQSALGLLLKEISKIEGKFFVRLLYIHPDHFNRDIFPYIQNDKRILPYFDIPFQSGDNKIILAMNRKGSQKEYVRLVNDIRSALPNAVLRTTFLTGFPGETDEAFENTKKFLKTIKSDWSGCFSYSREEDTKAYSIKNRVPVKVAKARVENLVKIQQEITANSLKKWIGQTLDILIEEVVDGEEGLAIGRAWFQAPEVDGSVVVRYEKDDEKENNAVKAGCFVRAKITSSSEVDLDSIFVGDSENNPENIEKDCSSLKFAPEQIK